MQKPDIIKGQAVSPELWQRARELRQQMTSSQEGVLEEIRKYLT